MRTYTLRTLILLGLIGWAITSCTIKGITGGSETGYVPTAGSESVVIRGYCDYFADQTGSNLGYGNYVDTTANSGTECACSSMTWDNGTPGGVRYIYSVGLDSQNTVIPKAAAALPPWATTASSRTPTAASVGWSADYPAFVTSSTTANLSAAHWYIFQSKVEKGTGSEVNCSASYNAPPTYWNVSASGAAQGTPMPPATNEAGVKEGVWQCQNGKTIKTTFEIAEWPNTDSLVLVPLYKSGDTNFGSMEIRSLTVSDWGDTTSLTVGNGSASQVITPSSGGAYLSSGTHYLWSEWFMTQTPEGGKYPTVQIEGSCAKQSGQTRVTQGYLVNLSPFYSGTSRIVARITNDALNSQQYLMIEVEGTQYAEGIPLTTKVPGRLWSFQTSYNGTSVSGTIIKNSVGLSVSITGYSTPYLWPRSW